jgi:hypothetical protein
MHRFITILALTTAAMAEAQTAGTAAGTLSVNGSRHELKHASAVTLPE